MQLYKSDRVQSKNYQILNQSRINTAGVFIMVIDYIEVLLYICVGSPQELLTRILVGVIYIRLLNSIL